MGSILKHQHEEELEFQIAPMVDVLLVILVFFITITSASVLRVDQRVNLPIADHAGKMVKSWNEKLINIYWDEPSQTGSVAVMDDKTGRTTTYAEMSELETYLKSEVAARGQTLRVIFRADRDTPSFQIQKVMGACAAAGIADITFSAVNLDKSK